ncbi:hypothetical protein BpHYR1_052668 [Brachionus plicatilis]|uniref:Uncharacterized protein n=1 Tax=Brachionus plicatilis TaxID=10195 RepID=A0A3M7QG05_BRAPC|nr:hypothetical protein BpHYR1_052668 [Brachionus plicatilis]
MNAEVKFVIKKISLRNLIKIFKITFNMTNSSNMFSKLRENSELYLKKLAFNLSVELEQTFLMMDKLKSGEKNLDIIIHELIRQKSIELCYIICRKNSLNKHLYMKYDDD